MCGRQQTRKLSHIFFIYLALCLVVPSISNSQSTADSKTEAKTENEELLTDRDKFLNTYREEKITVSQEFIDIKKEKELAKRKKAEPLPVKVFDLSKIPNFQDMQNMKPEEMKKMINDLNVDPQELEKMMEQLNQGGGGAGMLNPQMIQQLMKGTSGSPENSDSTLKPSNLVKIAVAGYKGMDQKQIIAILKDGTEESTFAKVLNRFPKIYVFMAMLLSDPIALPLLAEFVEDRQRLITYGGCFLATLVFGYILKRMDKKKNKTFIQGIKRFFKRFLILNVLRLSIFIFFFHREFYPTWVIFRKAFF